MCDALANRAKAVLCVGEKGPEIAAALARIPGAPSVRNCQTLANAISVAREIAQPGDVVLLSPGCKSQDQYVNFEERGDAFTQLARAVGPV